MNVLVINGSPRGEDSNSMQLTRAFLDGAGWNNPEFIEVSKAGVRACKGCFSCWNKTPGRCVISDGMSEILPKLVAADIVVWSFPLYYFGLPGDLKNLIDRQLPTALPFMAAESESGGHPSRYDLSHQRHVLISTCGFWTVQGNYESVSAMFDRYCGPGQYTTIFCGQGELFRVPELKDRTAAYLDTVRRAGAEYARGAIAEQTMAALSEPLYAREAFEEMADASWEMDEASGAAADNSLPFTRQMAALYQPDGVERVVELYYTDIEKRYQMLLTTQGATVIEDGFKPYTTRIETPFSLWRSIARGEISGPEALFQKRYQVLGDFDLMLQWDALFGGASAPKTAPRQTRPQKANMLLLLLPWIVIWTAMAIHPVPGGAAGILSVAILPLLWLVFRPVIFERIGALLVAALSLTVLLGADVRIVLPASYGVFGLMWIIGTFTTTPLTAHYSAAKYGDGDAFANPLFMRTNRILTAAWGMLYLVTPIWTYALMGTELAPYTGLINCACPALMGVFTAWFQKWYPAYWARKPV